MKIIISPAKKMITDDSMAYQGLPTFLSRTEELLIYMKGLSYQEAKSLWKCNDPIAELNMERLADMDLRRNLSPAILTYEGIQYRYMAPGVFEEASYVWIQEHLRILSGFYGILKPMDGIVPYRLEMQAKTKLAEYKDLYDFWGDRLYRELVGETGCDSLNEPAGRIGETAEAAERNPVEGDRTAMPPEEHVILNLASKEYSRCIEPYLTPEDTFITCVFAEEVKGKPVQKGTLAKMARGEMVRFLAERSARQPEEAKEFDRLGFAYRGELSSEKEYVFLRRGERCEN